VDRANQLVTMIIVLCLYDLSRVQTAR